MCSTGPDLPLPIVKLAFQYASDCNVPLAAFLGDDTVTLKMHPELEARSLPRLACHYFFCGKPGNFSPGANAVLQPKFTIKKYPYIYFKLGKKVSHRQACPVGFKSMLSIAVCSRTKQQGLGGFLNMPSATFSLIVRQLSDTEHGGGEKLQKF